VFCNYKLVHLFNATGSGKLKMQDLQNVKVDKDLEKKAK